jgi:hypothetical protein
MVRIINIWEIYTDSFYILIFRFLDSRQKPKNKKVTVADISRIEVTHSFLVT